MTTQVYALWIHDEIKFKNARTKTRTEPKLATESDLPVTSGIEICLGLHGLEVVSSRGLNKQEIGAKKSSAFEVPSAIGHSKFCADNYW